MGWTKTTHVLYGIVVPPERADEVRSNNRLMGDRHDVLRALPTRDGYYEGVIYHHRAPGLWIDIDEHRYATRHLAQLVHTPEELLDLEDEMMPHLIEIFGQDSGLDFTLRLLVATRWW